MSLKERRWLLQLLRGMILFPGHGKTQSMHSEQHFARSMHLYLVCQTWKRILLKLYIFVPQVSSFIVKFPKQTPRTSIIISHNIPSKVEWDLAVNRALQMIQKNHSLLTKVNKNSRLVIFLWFFPPVLLSCYNSIIVLYHNIMENQVVLARSTRVVPTDDIDPLSWLASLQVAESNLTLF